METIAEKLQYTSDAVDDIQAAINEKGVTVGNDTELGLYGDKIREISGGNSAINDFYNIEKFTAFSASGIMAKNVEDVSGSYSN